ncbi:MAG: LysR family transcriptional regulator [Albidovulum sp.]
MTVKLDMMRCFRATARDGTLAGAAEFLGRTPSAISMTLAQFEAHIGAPLFAGERKNRLTPLGLRVLEECDRALNTFDRSTEAIDRHARSTAGTVRVAAVPSATATILPMAIAHYRQTRPDVRLEVSDLDSASVLQRLQFDEADIGIVSSGHGSTKFAADVIGETLVTDRLGIVCRADSPVAEHPSGWDALAAEPLIMNPLCAFVDHPGLQALIASATLSAPNTMTLLSFVRSGLGATILPQRVLASEPPGLIFLTPDDPIVERCLTVLTPKNRPPSPASLAFGDALRAAVVQIGTQ